MMDERTELLRASLPRRYELLREHGRGGMAVVYLAVDRKHDRQVAIKVLAPELTAGIGAERFIREIQVAAHLNHPHILPLLDSGVADGLPFYVMPFVAGESLRARLSRDEPLPVHEALRVARDVAEALTYAHGHELVHRDIKPGNVLLTEGGAVVTDFGIAAAIDQLPEDHLTRTGLSVGSAGYMSPEQATGEPGIDGRADQYSLACVLFEMLAGRLPFVGRNARAILSRQLTEAAPAISDFRDDVPEGLDELLGRALAREPEERFATSQELEAALDDLAHRTGTGAALRFKTRPAIWVVLVLAVGLAAFPWLFPNFRRWRASPAPAIQLDTARYAVFPFQHGPGTDPSFDPSLLLQAAMEPWDEVDVVPRVQVLEALKRTGQDSLFIDETSTIAREAGAGRFVGGRVDRVDDSRLSVQAYLYAVTPGQSKVITDRSIVIGPGIDRDSAFLSLATFLLWRGDPPASIPDTLDTRSMDAINWADSGFDDINQWKLADADSAFRKAYAFDPEYAKANLWRAVVGSWSGADPATWQIYAHRAQMRSARLSDREAAMADALVLQAEGDFKQACSEWDLLASRYPYDFAPWYSLAVCLRSDDTVVADSTSPTGYAFRSSRYRAIEAYQKAFRILPTILGSFRRDSYASLRRALQLTQTVYVSGRSTDGGSFMGFPTWLGDTLAFWMRPDSVHVAASSGEWAARRIAVEQQRRLFREVATSWVTDAPRSALAREALAVGLALTGEAGAMDTLRRARELAVEPEEQRAVATTDVWLSLAFGLPNDPRMLQHARDLADSLLARSDELDPRLAASLAALLGHSARAAEYSQRMTDSQAPGPRGLESEESALLMFASLGGPADSLDRLARAITMGIETRVRPEERGPFYAWLGLPASLAHASHPLPGRKLSDSDWLVRAQLDAEAFDTSAVRAALEANGTARQPNPPYTRTLDAVFPEAALWMAIGRPDAAAEWLDPTMDLLPQVVNPLPLHPERVAPLVRAAALRAEAAFALGDSATASRWAEAVTVLWSDADPFLQPLVERMRYIAKCESC